MKTNLPPVTPANWPTLHKDGSVTYILGTTIARVHPDDLPEQIKRQLGYDNLAAQRRRAVRAKLVSPRFVWTIGAYTEQFPDMPADLPVCLWDRQERKAVVTIADAYTQAICLEHGNRAPFTTLEKWFNSLSNHELASEGLPETANRYAQEQ